MLQKLFDGVVYRPVAAVNHCPAIFWHGYQVIVDSRKVADALCVPSAAHLSDSLELSI